MNWPDNEIDLAGLECKLVQTTLRGPWNPPGEESNTSPEQLEKYHCVDKRSEADKPVKGWNLPQLTVIHPGGVMTGTDGWETVEEGTQALRCWECSAE